MTPFERALRERIAAEGSITVEAFMGACNAHYYATRDPLGEHGDFTTAPEVSQMFGEMVGAALADCWQRAGTPADAIYVELGAGRGTLAADALRVLRNAGFVGEVHFVETSPVLKAKQAEAVPGAQLHESMETLPKAPMLIVANEFLDALAIRQFVGGAERCVIIAGDGLAFDRDGEIMESSPERDEAVKSIAERLVANGGVALIFDYGHDRSAPGETFQAMRDHEYSPVLLNPGEQDLTAHVDFEAVGRIASEAGAGVAGPVRQGAWLRSLGIDARAAALAKAHPDRASDIAADAARLCDDEQMGGLFRVIALHSTDWPSPAGLA